MFGFFYRNRSESVFRPSEASPATAPAVLRRTSNNRPPCLERERERKALRERERWKLGNTCLKKCFFVQTRYRFPLFWGRESGEVQRTQRKLLDFVSYVVFLLFFFLFFIFSGKILMIFCQQIRSLKLLLLIVINRQKYNLSNEFKLKY